MYELEIWGEFTASTPFSLGYHRSSSLLSHDTYTGQKNYTSKLPAGLLRKGFDEYILVERVLNKLALPYRESALVEYALPVKTVGRTQKERAKYIKISPNTHNRRLRKIKYMVSEELFLQLPTHTYIPN